MWPLGSTRGKGEEGEAEIVNSEDPGVSTDLETVFKSAGLTCCVSQRKKLRRRERNAVFHHRPSILLERESGDSGPPSL